jgi:hypothetical protein
VPRECESLEPEKQNAEQRGNGWKSKRTFWYKCFNKDNEGGKWIEVDRRGYERIKNETKILKCGQYDQETAVRWYSPVDRRFGEGLILPKIETVMTVGSSATDPPRTDGEEDMLQDRASGLNRQCQNRRNVTETWRWKVK